jgi:hypothetical protein
MFGLYASVRKLRWHDRDNASPPEPTPERQEGGFE